MKLKEAKIGMKVKIVNITENYDDYKHLIGMEGIIASIENKMIRLNSIAGETFYPEELKIIDVKKTLKFKDLIL